MDDEATIYMVNEEFYIDSDDEIDLEIEGETANEESSNKKSESGVSFKGYTLDRGEQSVSNPERDPGAIWLGGDIYILDLESDNLDLNEHANKNVQSSHLLNPSRHNSSCRKTL
jgi:hypothetical protein